MAKNKIPENTSLESEEMVNPEISKKEKNKKLELKWKHYVLEFFIVALGISVPFLLSKWNENSNLLKAEKQYYSSFKQELTEDLGSIQGNISYNQRHIVLLEKGVDIILTDKDRLLVDSLGIVALSAIKYSDFHKNSSIYEMLAKSGELDIFGNKEILLQLQNIEKLYTYINRLEETHQEAILITFIPSMDFIRLKPLKVMKPDKLYSYQFQNNLEIYLSISYEKDSLYHAVEVEINNLIVSLDKELE